MTQIVIVNWSHQPETLYAKTIVRTIEKLYDNADIAVIVDNSNTGTEENAPVSHAEAQYDDIAQGVQVETQRTDSLWYDSIQWDEMNLTAGQKTALLALILQFTIIFAMNPTDLGLTHLMKHDIDVGDAAPVWQPQYRLPHAYRPLITQQLEHLKMAGVISESHSPWNSPLVVIRIEGNHIFLTPIDKPNAKPFSWHIDHAKLAHTVDRTIIGLNPTNDQLRKLQTKNKIQYPIEHPAQHRHDLRSKRRAENQ